MNPLIDIRDRNDFLVIILSTRLTNDALTAAINQSKDKCNKIVAELTNIAQTTGDPEAIFKMTEDIYKGDVSSVHEIVLSTPRHFLLNSVMKIFEKYPIQDCRLTEEAANYYYVERFCKDPYRYVRKKGA